MNGCIKPNATDGIEWSVPLQLRDQPIDSPRERGQVPLRQLAPQATAPRFVRRPEPLDQGSSTTRQLQARRSKIVRIIAALGQPELLQSRHHAGHVLLR